jgi:hypothetical protein
MSADWMAATEPCDTGDEDDPQSQELLDEADEFEEQLAAEMLRTGAIEVWM